MQNNLVRGPHKKAGMRSVGQSMVMDRGNYQILRFAQNDNALLRMTFLVTIDAAADGVKDLKEDSLSI